MMKLLFLGVVWFILPLISLAQKEDYNWVIPANAILHFTDSIPYIKNLPWRSYEGTETNTSISDSVSKLNIYVNATGGWQRPFLPDTVWKNRSIICDAQRDTIVNGDNINMYGTITNGALFIRFESKIYLFHLCTWYVSPPPPSWHDSLTNIKLFMTVIERQDSHWVVTEKNKLLSDQFRLVEKLAAVRHANSKDWWIITHDWKDNIFHTFLFSEGKIQGAFSHKTGQFFNDVGRQNNLFFTGEIAVSPDGSKLLLANSADIFAREYGAELFYFDRCCGKITFWKGLKKRKYYGASFSPNGKFIYLAPIYGHTYQFETDAENIEATEIQVSPDSLPQEFGRRGAQLELGPDGKLYFASQGSRYIGAILNPNQKGKACEFKPNFIPYGKDGVGGLGLPSFPNYRLGAMEPAHYHHDTTICPDKKTVLGLPPDCDYSYEWSPSTGLSDTTIAMPAASISKNTAYVRRTYSARFGCTSRYDTFYVQVLEKTDTSCFVSRAEPEPKYLLEMYPNPARDNVTLSYNLPEGIQCKVELFNVSGSQMMKFDLKGHKGTEEIKLTGLADGMYLAQFRLSNGELITQKLIIAH